MGLARGGLKFLESAYSQYKMEHETRLKDVQRKWDVRRNTERNGLKGRFLPFLSWSDVSAQLFTQDGR